VARQRLALFGAAALLAVALLAATAGSPAATASPPAAVGRAPSAPDVTQKKPVVLSVSIQVPTVTTPAMAPLRATITVANLRARQSGRVELELRLSKDGKVSADDAQLAPLFVPSIAPKKRGRAVLYVFVQPARQQGTRLLACVKRASKLTQCVSSAPLRVSSERPLPVSVATSDDPLRTSATLDQSGGSLTATGADGTRFTLAVPAGALSAPTAVTLTPVKTLVTSPSLGALVAGVIAEPEGLIVPGATLEIALPGPAPPLAEPVGFGQGSSNAYRMPELVTRNTTLPVLLLGGYAIVDGAGSTGKGTPGIARACAAARTAAVECGNDSFYARFSQTIAEALALARKEAQSNPTALNVNEFTNLAAELWNRMLDVYRESAERLLAKSPADGQELEAAQIGMELGAIEQSLAIMGIEANASLDWRSRLQARVLAIVKARCGRQGRQPADQIRDAWLVARAGRSNALLGGSDEFTQEAFAAADACLRATRFELDFSDLVTVDYVVAPNTSVPRLFMLDLRGESIHIPLLPNDGGVGMLTPDFAVWEGQQPLTFPVHNVTFSVLNRLELPAFAFTSASGDFFARIRSRVDEYFTCVGGSRTLSAKVTMLLRRFPLVGDLEWITYDDGDQVVPTWYHWLTDSWDSQFTEAEMQDYARIAGLELKADGDVKTVQFTYNTRGATSATVDATFTLRAKPT